MASRSPWVKMLPAGHWASTGWPLGGFLVSLGEDAHCRALGGASTGRGCWCPQQGHSAGRHLQPPARPLVAHQLTRVSTMQVSLLCCLWDTDRGDHLVTLSGDAGPGGAGTERRPCTCWASSGPLRCPQVSDAVFDFHVSRPQMGSPESSLGVGLSPRGWLHCPGPGRGGSPRQGACGAQPLTSWLGGIRGSSRPPDPQEHSP